VRVSSMRRLLVVIEKVNLNWAGKILGVFS
jgi:hypothetical protein